MLTPTRLPFSKTSSAVLVFVTEWLLLMTFIEFGISNDLPSLEWINGPSILSTTILTTFLWVARCVMVFCLDAEEALPVLEEVLPLVAGAPPGKVDALPVFAAARLGVDWAGAGFGMLLCSVVKAIAPGG
jgi:hypothetical protein